MARTTRSRRIAASPEAVWEIVADPHHLPRWWPGVARVEDVRGGRFTEVIPTKRGKPVRLDFRVIESEPPSRRSWTQELPGTPFERLLTPGRRRSRSSPQDRLRAWSRSRRTSSCAGRSAPGCCFSAVRRAGGVDAALAALAALFC